MGEILVSEIGKVGIEPRRRLMTEVVASAVALVLAASALSALKQEPPAFQAVVSIAPIVDRSTGKIVDRFGEKALAELAEPRPAQNSVTLFAPGVDLGPALTALIASAERREETAQSVQVAAQDTPAPAVSRAIAKSRTPARASVKAVVVADAAPLPPPRPETLGPEPAQASALVAEASVTEPSGLFGWRLPAEILPTGQKVLRQVASLSGAVLDRLTP
jgi:hypothetical protein